MILADVREEVHWQMRKQLDDSPAVLAAYSGTNWRFAEDPADPMGDVVSQLSGRLDEITMLVTPPCSMQTYHGLMNRLPRLKRILVCDWFEPRISTWQEALPTNLTDYPIDVIMLPRDELQARKVLEDWLHQELGDLFLGRGAVYVPMRFRRLDGEFSRFLQTTVLLLQQEACSAAAFKTTRNWHMSMNTLLNVARDDTWVLESFSEPTGTAVIVGAGPSLDLNVGRLHDLRRGVLVIATDAAVNTLLQNDVSPDFIVSLEDTYLSWRFFAQGLDQLNDVPLVVPIHANNALVKNYPGPVIFCGGGKTPRWAAPILQSCPVFPHGQCVGHFGYHFAEWLNMETIVLAGFDFAFRDEAFHTEGMAYKYVDDKTVFLETVEVPGVYGAPVKTVLNMSFYLKYLSERVCAATVRVVDATEGGALISGCEVMSLVDAISDERARPAPILKRKDLFNPDQKHGFVRGLITQCDRVHRNANILAENLNNGTLDLSGNPIQHLDVNSDAFELISTCCSILVMSRYADMVQRRAELSSEEFCEGLSSMLAEICDAGRFIQALGGVVECPCPGPGTLILRPDSERVDGLVDELVEATGAQVLAAQTPLPHIWETMVTCQAGVVIGFDGEALPDTWAPMGALFIDIKTQTTEQPYERHMWIPGYCPVSFDAEIAREWRDCYPNGIVIKRMTDVGELCQIKPQVKS